MAQTSLRPQWLYDHLMCITKGGLTIYCQFDRFTGFALEGSPWIGKFIEGYSIHSQDEVSFFDIHTRHVKGRSYLTVPTRTPHDFLDLKVIVFFRPIDTKVSHIFCLRSLLVSPSSIRMGGIKLTDQLTQDKVYVVAGHAILNHLAIHSLHSCPVHAMHFLIVKEITLKSPGVKKDLAPLFTWIDHCFHFAHSQFILKLLSCSDIDHARCSALTHEHLLSICRNGIAPHTAHDGLGLFFLEIKVLQLAFCIITRARVGIMIKNQFSRHRTQIAHISCLYREYHDTSFKPIKIDLDSILLIFLIFTFSLIITFFAIFTFYAIFTFFSFFPIFPFFLIFLIFLNSHIIIFWRKWRGNRISQRK